MSVCGSEPALGAVFDPETGLPVGQGLAVAAAWRRREELHACQVASKHPDASFGVKYMLHLGRPLLLI